LSPFFCCLTPCLLHLLNDFSSVSFAPCSLMYPFLDPPPQPSKLPFHLLPHCFFLLSPQLPVFFSKSVRPNASPFCCIFLLPTPLFPSPLSLDTCSPRPPHTPLPPSQLSPTSPHRRCSLRFFRPAFCLFLGMSQHKIFFYLPILLCCEHSASPPVVIVYLVPCPSRAVDYLCFRLFSFYLAQDSSPPLVPFSFLF